MDTKRKQTTNVQQQILTMSCSMFIRRPCLKTMLGSNNAHRRTSKKVENQLCIYLFVMAVAGYKEKDTLETMQNRTQFLFLSI